MMLGTYELRIKANLIEHPDVETSVETVLPLELIRCPIDLLEWEIGDVLVPPITEATHLL